MAALYEGYTLCGLIPDQSNSSSGIDGIEEERDSDHVIVTDSNRSVTLYKVPYGFSQRIDAAFQGASILWRRRPFHKRGTSQVSNGIYVCVWYVCTKDQDLLLD